MDNNDLIHYEYLDPEFVTDGDAMDVAILAKQLRGEDTYTSAYFLSKSASRCFFLTARANGVRGNIIGMARLKIDHTPWDVDASIEDVVVHRAFRRRGIARSLMEKLIKEARKNHVTTIQLTSRNHRVEAHKLYENLGFECRETNVFELAL